MPTKLEVYNETLGHLKARRLQSTSDARAERREMDAAWEAVIDYMLERGMWNFATRAQQWMASDTVESNFGYRYAFQKPDDYVRLTDISVNERFEPTLEYYHEEGSYYFCETDTLYVKFVSSDASWGRDLGKWPPAFTSALALELAWRICGSIGSFGLEAREALRKDKKRALAEAKASDAVNQARATLPTGRLVNSRVGYLNVSNRMRRTPYA